MYLDPAFGGMILQIILALVVVGGTMIFAMRRKAKMLLNKKQDDIYQDQPKFNPDASDHGVIDTLLED